MLPPTRYLHIDALSSRALDKDSQDVHEYEYLALSAGTIGDQYLALSAGTISDQYTLLSL